VINTASLAEWWIRRSQPKWILRLETEEAILDGRQPAELGVHVLREWFPVEWGEQSSRIFHVGAPA